MTQEIQDFLKILRALQKIDAEFPLQYAVCLAEISREEGLSLTQLCDKTGLAISTVSRIVGALSDSRQKGRPYGLVRVVISPAERRRKELYLTPRGKASIKTIAAAVAGAK